MPEPTRTDQGIPIIPDRVAEKIQAGKSNWDLSEVLGESTVEQVAAENAARSQAIHAEDLTPISKEEAASRVTFDGEHLPRAPQTRRVIPAPFQRPVINLSLPWEPRRTWQNVPVALVEEGDIIPDLGQVVDISTRVKHEHVAGVGDVAVGVSVRLTGKGGATQVHDQMAFVRVFRF